MDFFDGNIVGELITEDYVTNLVSPNNLVLSNAIFDEIHGYELGDKDLSNVKESWTAYTFIYGKFEGNTNAGNIDNEGVPIDKLKLNRRTKGKDDEVTLAIYDYAQSGNIEFSKIDWTQGAKEHIYSVIPIGINGLIGKKNETEISTPFIGYWIMDIDDADTYFVFDKTIDDGFNSVTKSKEEDRSSVSTYGRFPVVGYTPAEKVTFDIDGAFLNRPGKTGLEQYEDLEELIREHKPLLVKNGVGETMICDIHSPTNSIANIAEKDDLDYVIVNVKAEIISDYTTYMRSRVV